MKKKLLSALLCLALMVQVAPMAFAASKDRSGITSIKVKGVEATYGSSVWQVTLTAEQAASDAPQFEYTTSKGTDYNGAYLYDDAMVGFTVDNTEEKSYGLWITDALEVETEGDGYTYRTVSNGPIAMTAAGAKVGYAAFGVYGSNASNPWTYLYVYVQGDSPETLPENIILNYTEPIEITRASYAEFILNAGGSVNAEDMPGAVTEPDTTEPDTTEPDTTEPDTTEPDTTEPDTTTVTKFSDVLEDAWYTEYIYEMAAKGVVNGDTAGTFRPTDSIKWGEALKMALAANGYEAADADSSHWASGWLSTAIANELIEGEAVDLESAITRVEFCRLLGKAMKLDVTGVEGAFNDTDDAYVAAFAAAGVVNGKDAENGLFAPSESLQRCEICKILSLSAGMTAAEGESAQ